MKTARLVLACAALMTAAGCSHLGYYFQAAHGQFSLMSQARPIDEWLDDPRTDAKLKVKLQTVQRIRKYAANELALPQNESYTAYVDLKRPFAVWNVVATPALSMKPKSWCFPVAGCVTYRGYYNKDDAEAYADELRQEGYDVRVGGVAAYSTLGWFADPVLSTFIHYPEGELARLIFHELAHQVAYAPGDSQFNESFATAVEEAGVERWLASEGNASLHAAYWEFRERKQQFLALLLRTRSKLEALYAGPESDAEKLRQKTAIFTLMQEEYRELKASWGGFKGYDRFFAQPLSNAHLAEIATYHAYVPAFRALLAQQHSLPSFYASVKALASMSKGARSERMLALSPMSSPTAAPQAAAESGIHAQ